MKPGIEGESQPHGGFQTTQLTNPSDMKFRFRMEKSADQDSRIPTMQLHESPLKQHKSSLNLHIASSFLSRLRGLHGKPELGCNEGLLIIPCRSIHTFFLRTPIDVVFLDGKLNLCALRERLPPNRIAHVREAAMVVELPAGYCSRHPQFLRNIHAALQLRVFPRLLVDARSSIVQPSARSGDFSARL